MRADVLGSGGVRSASAVVIVDAGGDVRSRSNSASRPSTRDRLQLFDVRLLLIDALTERLDGVEQLLVRGGQPSSSPRAALVAVLCWSQATTPRREAVGHGQQCDLTCPLTSFIGF